jgi:putative FmdB family regulatory protein
MPRYDYRCMNCDLLFEVRHEAKDTPMPMCPACGGLSKRSVLMAPTVIKGNAVADEPVESAHQCGPGCAMHYPREAFLPESADPAAD